MARIRKSMEQVKAEQAIYAHEVAVCKKLKAKHTKQVKKIALQVKKAVQALKAIDEEIKKQVPPCLQDERQMWSFGSEEWVDLSLAWAKAMD